jgi:hypothetical protein
MTDTPGVQEKRAWRINLILPGYLVSVTIASPRHMSSEGDSPWA